VVVFCLVCGGQRSCSSHRGKKKKKIRLIDVWVVETLICVQRLSLLLLFLKWPACSAFSGESPAMLRQSFFFSLVAVF
jgi:hypothetical protein